MGLVTVIATLLLATMFAFAEQALAASPSLVINEVYAPIGGNSDAQWLELYNRSSAPIVIDGWKLRTANNEYPLPTITVSPVSTNTTAGFILITFSRAAVTNQFGGSLANGVVIVDLGLSTGPLNPQADMLSLVSSTGLIVDQVNWGPVGSGWKNANTLLWQPTGDTPLESPATADGKTQSLGRTWNTEGKDTDSPADFTVHTPASPGTKSPRQPLPSEILGKPTDVMSWAAGVLLWIGFILAALIARRFQNLSGQRTYWQALLIAPSGILIYTIIQGLAFGQSRAMNDSEKWTGFPILFLSAILCFYVIAIFSGIAKRYLEAGK